MFNESSEILELRVDRTAAFQIGIVLVQLEFVVFICFLVRLINVIERWLDELD